MPRGVVLSHYQVSKQDHTQATLGPQNQTLSTRLPPPCGLVGSTPPPPSKTPITWKGVPVARQSISPQNAPTSYSLLERCTLAPACAIPAPISEHITRIGETNLMHSKIYL